MKEYWEDCKYIAKVASQGFRLVVVIKITIIPILVAVASYAASFWPALAVPKWAWIPVTTFAIMLSLLFIMARQMRMLATPKIIAYGDIQPIKPHHDKPYDLYVAVRNISHNRIEGLKVKLKTILVNERVWQQPDILLPILNHEDVREISINPGDEEKAFIGKFWKDHRTGHYIFSEMEYTDFPSISFFVQISSKSLPVIDKRIILTNHDSGGFSFAEEGGDPRVSGPFED